MIKNWKNKLFLKEGHNKTFIENIIKILLGTGVARLIGIASIPILTRIYTPFDYGVLTLYIAAVNIIAPILTLRYILAIPLPRSEKIAINILTLSILLIIFNSFIFLCIFFFFSGDILNFFSMSILTPWWWMVILGAFFLASYETISQWMIRKQLYGVMSQTKVIQASSGEGIKIILGLISLKPFGLLLGAIVEQISGVAYLLYRTRKDLYPLKREVKIKYLFFNFKYYRDFPFFRLPSQFLLVFSIQAPALFSASLYGVEITGQLGLALMALLLPISIIGNSVGQVFYGEIARLPKGSAVRVKELIIFLQKRLFCIGIPISLILLFFGKTMFVIVFGEKWYEAGKYASLLAPYLLLSLTSTPLVQVLNIHGSQKSFLSINIIRVVGLMVIYLVCRQYDLQPVSFVTLLGGYLFLFYLVLSLYVIYVVNKEINNQIIFNSSKWKV